MLCLAIRHIECEDLGVFAPQIESLFDIHYVDMPPSGEALPDLELARSAELVISLGGPMSAYDAPTIPFLAAEIDILRDRIEKDRPTLGLCLGSQLLAAAAGARVYPSGQQEIGWYSVDFTPGAAMNALLAPLADGDNMFFHWHGDTFELPADARLVGSSGMTPRQGFLLGHNIVALQFHPEVSAGALENWLAVYESSMPAGDGVMPPEKLREGAAHHAAAMGRCARLFMAGWIKRIYADQEAQADSPVVSASRQV